MSVVASAASGMNTVGAAAEISVRHVGRRVSWFSTVARKAPYVSGVLIVAVGLYVGWHGITGLAAHRKVELRRIGRTRPPRFESESDFGEGSALSLVVCSPTLTTSK